MGRFDRFLPSDTCFAANEIGVGEIGHLGVLVHKPPDSPQLTSVFVLDCGLDKWELFSYALSHRGCFPF